MAEHPTREEDDDGCFPPNASTRLLAGGGGDDASDVAQGTTTTTGSGGGSVASRISYRLYVSHFLSTWNSRVFEFGSVLYLAAIFPGTLLPLSVYALVRGLAAIAFAPSVGKYIDSENRLKVVRVSIVFQRIAVAISCLVFYALSSSLELGAGWKPGMLAFVSFLACIEKLCSIMNFVSVEKDWVVVVAGNDQDALKTLNAQMRRIDLLCKLLGPLSIALLDGFSTRIAILVNFGMNLGSVVLEYFAIARVYHEVPNLQNPKTLPVQHQNADARSSRLRGLQSRVGHLVRTIRADHSFYFHHPAFKPSMAGALLYLTVLSFSGQIVTYLISTGYSSTQVGIARTVSVSFEVLATWAAPWLMGRIGPVRAGLWMSCWQTGTLGLGIAVFWRFGDSLAATAATGLVVGTILSRLGLFGFDLCVQVIVQEEVEPENRGAFSSVEVVWQNFFDLLSFAATIVFYQPSDFKWPSLISWVAVACASVLYSNFVRSRRGHLLHPEALSKICDARSWGNRNRARERSVERLLGGSERRYT